MPNRIVRDAILTSVPVCSLGWPEEVLYRRLMSVADDYGRCDALPQLIRSRCYPLQTDQVRVADITRWLAACEKAGLIVLYEANGKPYLQIEKFGQQQRSASKYPQPPASDSRCQQPMTDAHLGVVVSVAEGVSVVEGDRALTRRPAKRCPDDFEVDAEMSAWATEHAAGIDVAAETAAFMDHEFPRAYSDWPATWRNWIRRAAKNRTPQSRASPHLSRHSGVIADMTGRQSRPPQSQPETIDVESRAIAGRLG